MRIFISFVIVLFLLVGSPVASASNVYAGKLGDFEKELEKPKPKKVKKPAKKTEDGPAGSCPGITTSGKSELDSEQIVTAGLMQVLISFFLAGLMETGGDNMQELYRELKDTWSPALPTIRVEPSYQYLAGNLHGFSGKAEAGYLIAAVDGEYLRYWEKNPDDDFTIASAHLQLRTLFADFIGTNLAIGAKSLWGERRHTGFEFGMPFYVFIGKHFIVDAQPFLAIVRGRDVYDIGGGASFKYKLFGVRAGYRMLKVGSQYLHGPRAGVFLQW